MCRHPCVSGMHVSVWMYILTYCTNFVFRFTYCVHLPGDSLCVHDSLCISTRSHSNTHRRGASCSSVSCCRVDLCLQWLVRFCMSGCNAFNTMFNTVALLCECIDSSDSARLVLLHFVCLIVSPDLSGGNRVTAFVNSILLWGVSHCLSPHFQSNLNRSRFHRLL